MKKMKRVVAMLLAVVMVFGLAACGSKKSGDDSGKEEKSNYPEKQITLICPLAAGGGSDTISRLFAAAMEKELGVSVVVENKPGAGAGVGLEAIASSNPDGYTIGYIPAEVTTVEAMGNATVTPEDFEYICTAMKISALICVPADSEWDSLDDLIAAAKENPGSITIGTAGVGNAYELGLRSMLEQQKQFHMLILENLRFCVTFLLNRQNYFRMYQQLQSLVMNAMVDHGEHLRYRQEHRMM